MIKFEFDVTASSNGKVINCHVCLTLNSCEHNECRICQSKLHSRNKHSLQNTIALLFTGFLFYIPANVMPIMYTNLLGQKTGNTILGGVITLWQQGSYPIALIIFIASVLVPIGKMIALAWLCYGVATDRFSSYQKHHTLYRLTEFIGRWSMVDVFVVAILVALIQMGNLMSIYPGVAAIAFAGMVIATMLAAMTFDPRLIWDPVNAKSDLNQIKNQK
ncbi:MAG: paraquat-inducible protein A [Kangiellaceae bacterium]|nr:paraquat-inducible protein A [Kangiellaceae bacterium]MCW9016539.1 paraquat-inducible protein A [Kangiellaceae bacterium]